MTKPSPFIVPIKSTALESVSADIDPFNLVENGVGNAPPCTESEDEYSIFFVDVDFIHEIETIKASAKERGDKKAEAFAIASLSFYRFIKNRSAIVGAVKKWVDLIERNAIIKNFPFIRSTNENLVTYIHSKSKWRSLKQGPEAVRKFAQERADLAERIKTIIPKEASAWATSQVASGDLNVYIPQILRTHNLYFLVDEISDCKFFILPELSKKIVKLDDMELWSEDHVTSALFEIKEIRSLIIDELYRVIFSSYATTAMSFWMFLNQHEQIDESESAKYDFPSGNVHGNDCDCEDCQHDRRISEGVDPNWMISLVGNTICESKAWGSFAPFIKTIFDLDGTAQFRLLCELSNANAVVWRAGQDLIEEHRLKEVALKDARKDKKQSEKDMEHTKAQIANLNRQVDQMRKARTKPGSKPVPVDTSSLEEELRLSKKANEQIRDGLSKKEAELKQVYALLDSVLSSQQEEDSLVSVKLTPAEFIEKRGVMIGGHYTLITKLRKELTNCVFYSPDAKSLDDDAVRNCEYILFITGYVNHSLTGHALRLSRLYNIPCGYTTRTNVPLILEDVAAIFAGSVSYIS